MAIGHTCVTVIMMENDFSVIRKLNVRKRDDLNRKHCERNTLPHVQLPRTKRMCSISLWDHNAIALWIWAQLNFFIQLQKLIPNHLWQPVMIIAIVHCIEYHEWPNNINPYWSEAVLMCIPQVVYGYFPNNLPGQNRPDHVMTWTKILVVLMMLSFHLYMWQK